MNKVETDLNGIRELTKEDIVEYFKSIKYDDDILSTSIDEEEFGDLPDNSSWWNEVLDHDNFHSDDIEDDIEDDDPIGIGQVIFVAESEEELEIETSLDEMIENYELEEIEKAINNL